MYGIRPDGEAECQRRNGSREGFRVVSCRGRGQRRTVSWRRRLAGRGTEAGCFQKGRAIEACFRPEERRAVCEQDVFRRGVGENGETGKGRAAQQRRAPRNGAGEIRVRRKFTVGEIKALFKNGERGIGCHADRIAEFEDGVDRAIDYATALGCKQLNCLAGLRPAHRDPMELRETFIRNLQFAAIRTKAAGIKLLIEAINTRDIPGFFLTNSAQAVDIIKAAGSDNLFFQYDIYHMQIMEGDVIATIRRHHPYIAHYHTGGVPGRGEIDESQELYYPAIMRAIVETGFKGFVAQEFVPKRPDVLASLKQGVTICDV